jgi:hypothetical protein
MKIHLYTICWNEGLMLDFFFTHYQPWVERFVIYDDGSTDDSLAILTSKPNVEVRRFPRSHPDSYVLSAKELQNNCWKESRGNADWVVVTAIDEHLHLYHHNILKYLSDCKNQHITLIPALGYQMLTDEFPEKHEHLATTRTNGTSWGLMNKLSIFDPNVIRETNFGVGRHSAEPEGDLKPPKQDELLLLHYKYLGMRYLVQRNSFLNSGLGPTDRAHGWGIQYTWNEKINEQSWQYFQNQAVDVKSAWENNKEPRWWRETSQDREESSWLKICRRFRSKFQMAWMARRIRLV